MRQDSERRKELQKAEYRNRKKGMETGRTEEEKQGSRKEERQHRRNRRQGRTGRREKKDGRLSSQNQTEVDERKRKRGESPKAKAKGKHRWNSCGSETGRDERKQTESRVRRIRKESMRNQAGENEENLRSESGRGAPKKPL